MTVTLPQQQFSAPELTAYIVRVTGPEEVRTDYISLEREDAVRVCNFYNQRAPKDFVATVHRIAAAVLNAEPACAVRKSRQRAKVGVA